MSGDEEYVLIRSANTTMKGEADMLKRRTAIHRDLDGLENKANTNFIKFNIHRWEQSQLSREVITFFSPKLVKPHASSSTKKMFIKYKQV